MTSAECEQRYFNGELGDSKDVIRWIHDYHSYWKIAALVDEVRHAKDSAHGL